MQKLNETSCFRMYIHMSHVESGIFPVQDKRTYITSTFEHIESCGFVVGKGSPKQYDIDNFNKIRIVYGLPLYIINELGVIINGAI